MTLGWPGRLGRPVLAGTTATYADVAPGVDLVVDARRSGYEQHIVIKTPQARDALVAGAAGQTVSWTLPVKTQGLTARSEDDGSVSFVDVDGVVASRLMAPVAWYAVIDPRSGDHANTTPVAMSVAQKGRGKAAVTLSADKAWLADPARQFPITVDPTYASVTLGTSFDTYVQSNVANTDESASTELRAGSWDGGTTKTRSYINFSAAGVLDKKIMSATAHLFETYSYSCTAKPLQIRAAYSASTATRWSSQPTTSTTYSTTINLAKGYSSSCADAWVTANITSIVDMWSRGSTTGRGLALFAGSESDSYGYKKFASRETAYDPYITYTYDRKPGVAAQPGMPDVTAYHTDSGITQYFTADSTPRFSSVASDADGNSVSFKFEVHSSESDSGLVASCSTTYVLSGQTGICAIDTALAEDRAYYVRAAVEDNQGLWNGTWSAWAKFYTTWSKPPAPTVSCTGGYGTTVGWTDASPASDVVCDIYAPGVSGTYVAPGYLNLTIDGKAQTRLQIAPTNSATTVVHSVTFSRTAQGAHSLSVVGVSRSLQTSTATTVNFGWGGASMSLPSAGTTSSGTIKVAARGRPRSSTTQQVTGKIQWRLAGDANQAWTDGPSQTVPPAADGSLSTSWTTQFDLATAKHDAGTNTDLPTRVPVLLDVQVCFAYSGMTGWQCTGQDTPRSVTRLAHAFGAGYPVADAGPGQVALFTGEFQTSATDVTVPGFGGDLSISRSQTSFAGDGTAANWPSDPVTGIFGPGWTANLDGPEAGEAGLAVYDGTLHDGTIALVDEDGSALVWRTPSKNRTYTTGTWLPITQDTIDTGAKLTLTGTIGSTMQLKLTEADETVTTWTPVAYSAGVDTDWRPVSVNPPAGGGQTTFGKDGAGRIVRIVTAPPNADGTPAVTCPSEGGTLVKGCRALNLTYDLAGQLTQVEAVLWDPTVPSPQPNDPTHVGAMVSTVVATYLYDDQQRLVSVRDPRTQLGTDYAWVGTSTHLASVKPSGLAAYRLTYESTGAAPKLLKVARDNTSGTGTSTLARYVYGGTSSQPGLPDLSGAVDLWHQASPAATWYAVFGQDYDYDAATAAGTVDWKRADLQYADDLGYTVNTAQFGNGAWQITSTDYDDDGNVTRQLDPTVAAAAIEAHAAGSVLTDAQVDVRSTQNVYEVDSAGAALLTDTYGPQRQAQLSGDHDGDGEPDYVMVRPHTHTDYDETAPNGGVNPATGAPYDLATTISQGVVAGAALTTSNLETISTTVNAYTKLNAGDTSEGDGWALGTPTKVTTADITHTTRYDTSGRVTDVMQPLSLGDDAGTTHTVYYTADANTSHPECGAKPEWAGEVCATGPKAAPTVKTGKTPADGPASMPSSQVSGYTMWLQPETTVETSGSGGSAGTRTSHTTYDAAGRQKAAWTSSTIAGSAHRPGTFTHYAAATGLVDYTGVLNANRDDAETAGRSTTSYDSWGRTISATNSFGDVTTTAYVPTGTPGAGQVASVTEDPADPSLKTQATSWSYDDTIDGEMEHRGLATMMRVSRAGTGTGASYLTYTASYDDRGQITVQHLPGAVSQKTTYDEAGDPTALTYTGQVTPVTAREDADGNTVYDPGAPQQDQPWLAWTVRNDALGRVASEATGAGAGFDGVPGVVDLSDVTAPTVGQASAFDRSYRYDGAGRLTTVVDHTATGYGADLAASPCVVRDYAFDANGRRTGLTTTTHGDGDCTGTTDTTTAATGYEYDTADRPTKGSSTAGATAGTYSYDGFGRQLVIPASDAPTPAAGDIHLGYYDDDLARTITQGDTTTTLDVDAGGRRTLATTTDTSTTGSGTSTLARHYTDASDNPAWTIATNTQGKVGTTRYAESLGGDLAANINADPTSEGTAQLTLANLHGDVVTTIDIPATQDGATPATTITGWADYTEYGNPCGTAATPAAVAGTVGYGWLGAKQRSTTAETAGLTLMGDRLYNPATGAFTSTDPEPGGNTTAYTYPQDPINTLDLNGRWGHWKSWGKSAGSWAKRHRGMLATVAATAGCAVPGVGWASCGALQAAAWAVRSQQRASVGGGWRRTWRASASDAIWSAATFGHGNAIKMVKVGRLGRWRGPGRKVATEFWKAQSRRSKIFLGAHFRAHTAVNYYANHYRSMHSRGIF